jgi:hypothetical protein
MSRANPSIVFFVTQLLAFEPFHVVEVIVIQRHVAVPVITETLAEGVVRHTTVTVDITITTPSFNNAPTFSAGPRTCWSFDLDSVEHVSRFR